MSEGFRHSRQYFLSWSLAGIEISWAARTTGTEISSSTVGARVSSKVGLWTSLTVGAWDSSTVAASVSSKVGSWTTPTVGAWDSSTVAASAISYTVGKFWRLALIASRVLLRWDLK